MSPSPRDRLERAVKAQSMPAVPSVMQLINTASTQSNQRQSQQGSPASLNMSAQSKRATPPPMTQAPGNVSKLPSPPVQPSHLREDVVQDHYPPPGPVHAHSQPNVHQPSQPPPTLMHSLSQPNIHPQMNPQMGYPRPVNRIAPQFLNSYHAMEENWQMTDELMAEIERADYAQALAQQPPAPGTAGVAYAGGAQSGAVYIREAPSPHKDSVVDRVRGSGRSSPKEADTGRRPPVRAEPQRERDRDVQPSESVRARERPLPASPGSSPQGHPQPRGMSPERGSPAYLPTRTSSAEGASVGDFISFKRESYQPVIPTPPPTVRKQPNTTDVRTTPPAASKLASQTPPLLAMKTRTPDKSLPVQEEQEDDIALKESTVHSQYDHRSSPHRDDDDDTLIENDNDNEYGHGDTGEDGGSGSYTPRSPSVNLPESYSAARHYGPPLTINQRVASLTKHHRAGSTDQLGLQSFDAIVNQKPALRQAENQPPLRQQGRTFNEVRDNRDPRTAEQQQLNASNQNQNQRLHPLAQVHADDQNYEDPASAYLQMYFQSARPNAPIPPTPHSQTAAPSPSPLVTSMQPSPAPVGSPYPFPFSHVRRNMSYAPPTAPSSTYDAAAIEEQIALQMQMYALNNQPVLTDSTFSPSSTPFPGPGYNPWAFLQATRGFPGGPHRFDSMSLRSSPSHQPVNLPFPSSGGRGVKRREKSGNLRKSVSGAGLGGRDKVQPPKRVESTQPRDTSPEPYSSGEETAGEERYDVHEEAAWVNGDGDGDGEWVDESEDNKELIDLEYHPHYISNLDKRRRKWDARWETLQQAFQALDFETDTTMVLLAAPSHSTKLHSLTSRFVRRDQLHRSPAMANIRTAFKGIAGRRRASRAQSTSIVERLLNTPTAAGEGSDAGSESRESDLKRALETTLGSLDSLRIIYEQRVSRWEDEMTRIADERQRVELLLRQTLGVSLQQPPPIGPLLL